MAKEYKVWVVIEEHDTITDKYQDLDSTITGVNVFDSEEDAVACINDIVETFKPL